MLLYLSYPLYRDSTDCNIVDAWVKEQLLLQIS